VPIGKDFNLAVPLLRNNQLNGSIPIELGAVSNLEEPDVGRNFLAAFLQTWQTAAGCPILVRTETIGWEKSQWKFHRESSFTSFFCNRMLSKGPSLQAREI
jgi:hypothetical protein